MSEFTGERVIPGLVDADLFNEHVARYRFAAQFASGAVLDLGCGTGYGSAELLARAGSVVGLDISPEALRFARSKYKRARFVLGTAEALPFPDGSFDMVVAFEVIEHLERWPELIREAKRVLRNRGVLVVSTPNKAYYAEMRASTGPNPFHVHEFEFPEFTRALETEFAHVRMWTQNHADAIVFAPAEHAGSVLEAEGEAKATDAHFFVAVCRESPIDYAGLYGWVPSNANVLRERERHIARLEGELGLKDAWLAKSKNDLAELQQAHEATLAEKTESQAWARRLEDVVAERNERIVELQAESAERLAWVRGLEARIAELDGFLSGAQRAMADLETDLAARTNWARSIEEQLDVRTRHVLIQQSEIAEHEANIGALRAEIAEWQRMVAAFRTERSLIARSRWFRLGRWLRLGPVIGIANGEAVNE